MRYLALTTLSHGPSGTVIAPGDVVDVSHLTPDEVMMLESMSVIRPVADAPVVQSGTAPAEDGQEE